MNSTAAARGSRHHQLPYRVTPTLVTPLMCSVYTMALQKFSNWEGKMGCESPVAELGVWEVYAIACLPMTNDACVPVHFNMPANSFGHHYTVGALDVLKACDTCADMGQLYSMQCTDCVIFPSSVAEQRSRHYSGRITALLLSGQFARTTKSSGRTLELSLFGTFVSRKEISLLRTFVPWNFHCQERIFWGNFRCLSLILPTM